jgi:hypothetical protein
LDILDELKERMEVDDDTQKKLATFAPLALLGGAAVLATILRGKHIPVRQTATEWGDRGRRAAIALAKKIPLLPKPKE